MVSSRMDLSYPDDSYRGSDVSGVSYPLSISSYPTLWSIHTQQHVTKYLKFLSEKLLKTIKMHARMRKVYVWSYLLYCWTLRKSYRPEARGYVIYFPRANVRGE